jgi:hypothetical protein
MGLRIKYATALFVAVLAAGNTVTARADVQLVSDGGFENATPVGTTNGDGVGTSYGDGWSVTAGTLTIQAEISGVRVPHSGSRYAYLDWSNTVNTISRTLATVAGESYTLSFWLADTSPNAVSVSFGDLTVFSGIAPTNGTLAAADYIEQTYIVQATGTSTVLSFTGRWTTGAGTLLDDVSVTTVDTVPEPASLTVLAAGLLALLSVPRSPPQPEHRGRR